MNQINPKNIRLDVLYNQVVERIPIKHEYIDGIYLVGSIADPTKQIDKNGELSDIDIFLDVSEEADSISCIKGKYGSISLFTSKAKTKERPIQFLTSRQPGVSLNKFNHNFRLD